jgi:hypothetical protein
MAGARGPVRPRVRSIESYSTHRSYSTIPVGATSPWRPWPEKKGEGNKESS